MSAGKKNKAVKNKQNVLTTKKTGYGYKKQNKANNKNENYHVSTDVPSSKQQQKTKQKQNKKQAKKQQLTVVPFSFFLSFT